MDRLIIAASLLILLPLVVFAGTPNPSASLGTINAKVTCYAPGAGGNIEGPWATSRPAPSGGSATPRTLDDFRLGKSNFVTLAGNPMHYGKWYNMGSVTYVSNLDSRQYTISNVVGYVHDTGCAFRTSSEKGSCCARYKTCGDATRKFDIAYGDYRRGGNVGLVNSQALCANKEATWTQIGGPLSAPPSVTPGEQVISPLSKLLGPTSPLLQQQTPTPQAQQQSPSPQYAPQTGTAQPGQYFGASNPAVLSSPLSQQSPTLTSPGSNLNNNTNAPNLGSYLLELIRPVFSRGTTSPNIVITNPVMTSTTTTLGDTRVVITPVVTDGTTYTVPQTFIGQYMPESRPASQQRQNSNQGVVTLLETLKGALLRLGEWLRLR